MCGIAGFVMPRGASLGKEQESILDRCSAALRPRGPDGNGKWLGERVGFVHRRLAVIDTDQRSNQPMESERWVLSYNGEIFNFFSLRRELKRDTAFETTSDTEVLLRALDVWGLEGALARCAGMFAFLAYDKTTGITYAARDRMGIKPLVYSRLGDGSFVFASSVGAVVAGMPDYGWREYRPAIASFFVLGAPFTTTSVFEGIERLAPAHYLALQPDGSFAKHRYWSPNYKPDFSIEDLVDVVIEHQIADVQSALFLSGGVDSTFLASVTRDLDCFHLTSPERGYAKAVARRYDRKFVEVSPSLEGYVDSLQEVAAFHGEPLMSSGIPYAVSRAMSECGYKMAISANGADELLHGYPRTPIPEHAPSYLPLHESPSYTWFFEQLSHVFRDSRNFHLRDYADYVPNLVDIGYNATRHFHLSNFPPSASFRWFELMTYVLHDLNATLDAASMANGLEVRVPFLDHRIVEGVLSWHGSLLVTERFGRKAPLKAHLRSDFPRSFFNRPKVGFSIDEARLTPIVENDRETLKRMTHSGFVRLNSEEFGHAERDRIYLEKSCVAFEAWDSWRRETLGGSA